MNSHHETSDIPDFLGGQRLNNPATNLVVFDRFFQRLAEVIPLLQVGKTARRHHQSGSHFLQAQGHGSVTFIVQRSAPAAFHGGRFCGVPFDPLRVCVQTASQQYFCWFIRFDNHDDDDEDDTAGAAMFPRYSDEPFNRCKSPAALDQLPYNIMDTRCIGRDNLILPVLLPLVLNRVKWPPLHHLEKVAE